MATKIICDVCKKEADDEARQTWLALELSAIQPRPVIPLRKIDLCEKCGFALSDAVGEWLLERKKEIEQENSEGGN